MIRACVGLLGPSHSREYVRQGTAYAIEPELRIHGIGILQLPILEGTIRTAVALLLQDKGRIGKNRIWRKRPDGISIKKPKEAKSGIFCILEHKRMSDVSD